MDKTKRGNEKRNTIERSKLQSEVNEKIWASYSEEERYNRGRAISKSKKGKGKGKFSKIPARSRKCGLKECDNLVFEKILTDGNRKLNKYCCDEHRSIGVGKSISKANTKRTTIEKSDFDKYRLLVWKFTNRNNLSTLNGFEKRGKMKLNTNNTNLDHIYSIKDGYENQVPANIVGDIKNLRFIHWKENGAKGNISNITLNELMNKIKS